MILDEVLTGFRVGEGGWWGLENELSPWHPDLITFGKVVGGGLPLAAIGGSQRLMELLAPLGPVYQAGTLSGNPVAVAAGTATLRLATPEVYERLNVTAATIAEAAGDALFNEGVEHVIQNAGNLFSIVFSADVPSNYADVKAQEAFRYPAFFHSMLDSGISLPPSVFEAWFVSAAMGDTSISRILDALPIAAKAAARATATS